ncbi:MAG: malto-oligosyltrehalose trehalohydrolase [Candidatus Aminicenantes bacterium]
MEKETEYINRRESQFAVWAPFLNRVSLKMVFPEEKTVPMEKDRRGYWRADPKEIEPGTRYFYQLEGGQLRPDPASHFQPLGVHQPSQLVDHAFFSWEDNEWSGIPLSEMVMYELHVGTFTPEGIFEAVVQRLDDLGELGVNAINLMPVAQFPGERNWGYDGVHPFSVQNSYGGPEGLKRLVDACHKKNLAVILDVVYNHLGPEGNYLGEFGPYFTSRYRTPWGEAVNFDDAYSDDVRSFFIQNALHWFKNYHVDALRLDAVHAIYDRSAKPFLQELAEKVEEFSGKRGRRFYLIAESDLNDVRILRPREKGGYGLDAQWCDDFHHALHTLLTGEKKGYYADFGRLEHFGKSLREGYVISWDYSVYRKRHHGSSSKDRPAQQFIVFSQNHDQVGNRMLGERLSALISFEALKLADGAVILSPYIPLLFMGEEYAEDRPFFYFVSHSDPRLMAAVRQGRREEFQSFQWKDGPPDPQREETFIKSQLRWEKRKEGKHKVMLEYYGHLVKLRKSIPALYHLQKSNMEIQEWTSQKVLRLHRWHGKSRVMVIINFNNRDVSLCLNFPQGKWRKILDSSDEKWMGPGTRLPEITEGEQSLAVNPLSISAYQMEERE